LSPLFTPDNVTEGMGDTPHIKGEGGMPNK
jgi:hypothetical protein